VVTRRTLLVALASLAVACDTGFEEQSIVIDLRVLAIRSEPAEVVVDVDPDDLTSVVLPPVTFTALVADPRGVAPYTWTMTACGETFSLRCDDEELDYRVTFAEGTLASIDEQPTGVLQADVALLQAALEEDEFLGLGGIPVAVELVIRSASGEEVHAAKRIYYAPRQPPAKVQNQNPTLADLRARGEPWPDGQPLTVARGEQIELEPVESETVREDYLVPTLDGGSRMFTENLRYSWLATGGDFTEQFTGGAKDVFGNEPRLKTKWRAPNAEATIRMWIVQRDERGGTFWTERQILVP
jgi:hypothetical protein